MQKGVLIVYVGVRLAVRCIFRHDDTQTMAILSVTYVLHLPRLLLNGLPYVPSVVGFWFALTRSSHMLAALALYFQKIDHGRTTTLLM